MTKTPEEMILELLPCKPTELFRQLSTGLTESQAKEALAHLMNWEDPKVILTPKRVLVLAEPAPPVSTPEKKFVTFANDECSVCREKVPAHQQYSHLTGTCISAPSPAPSEGPRCVVCGDPKGSGTHWGHGFQAPAHSGTVNDVSNVSPAPTTSADSRPACTKCGAKLCLMRIDATRTEHLVLLHCYGCGTDFKPNTEFELAKMFRATPSQPDDFLHEFAQYAERKGEAWRIGEGAELMDAYQAVTSQPDAGKWLAENFKVGNGLYWVDKSGREHTLIELLNRFAASSHSGAEKDGKA